MRTLFEIESRRLDTVKAAITRRIFRYLFLLSKKHIANGRRQLVVFSFDFISQRINLDGLFEKNELDTLFQWLSTQPEVFDGIAIDVGANIGNHSLYFSDFYRSIHSFEPNPRTYQVLRLNSELVSNVFCYEVGLSNLEREARLNVYVDNIGHSDISSIESERSVVVRLKTLDGFSESMDTTETIRLIKFDVEGHEFQAIQGSWKTIRRDMPIILFEQLAVEVNNGTSKVIELLRSLGYIKFASIINTSTRLRSPGLLFGGILKILNSLPIAKSFLFGTTWSLQIPDSFEKANYPFIIAIPPWLKIST